MRRPLVALALAMQMSLVTGVASAADVSAADQAAAEGLFSEAKKLMADGKFQEACPKLEESHRLDPAPGTQFNLGECYEKIGRTASAWALFLNVAAAAKSAGMADREQIARDRAGALEPKLARLTIKVPTPTPNLEVKRDGVVVGQGQWGSSVAVDPGAHKISASAPGKQPWENSINVGAEGAAVDIPVLLDAPNTPEAPTTEPPKGEKDEGMGTQKMLALGALGIGVIGVGVGTFFGLTGMSKLSDAEGHCVGNSCDADGVELRKDAVSAGTSSTIFFTVGLIGLAGGAVLWFTAPKSQQQPPPSAASALTPHRVRVTPTVGTNGAGVMLGGAF